MAEVVNLNRWRKAKAKAASVRQAEVNRVAFGRTKVEKEQARKQAEQQAKDLDGKKVEQAED